MDSNIKHFRSTRKLCTSSCYIKKDTKSFMIIVNGRNFSDYFYSLTVSQLLLNRLKEIIKDQYQFNYIIKVSGGGLRSQLDAVLSSICKSILNISNEKDFIELKSIFKKSQLLISDDRRHKRHTAGQPGRSKGPVHNKR